MRTVLISLTIVVCTIIPGCDQSPQLPRSVPSIPPSIQGSPNPDQDEKESEPPASPGRAPGQASGSAGDWPGHGGIESEASRPPYPNAVGASEDPSLTSPHGPPHIIVAFGNSLTSGLGVAPQESYPAQLEARLRAMGYPYRVVNAGISGDTTAGGMRRLDGVIKAKPEIVIIELGANDGLRGIALNEVRANLSQIIKHLKAEGTQVVLAGMRLPPNYGPMYTTGFTNLYSQLAKEYDIPLIPFFLEGVAIRPELNQDDGIHPTAEGYRRVVDNVLPVLLPLLSPHAVSNP